jgi:uncharacterized membrane protein YkvA (DUF1232 family)
MARTKFDPTDGADDPDIVAAREKKVRREFWDKLKRVAGSVPFAEDLVAGYYCALDQDTPLRVRGMLLGALAYFILPMDVVPDMILGLGFTDDAAVLATVFSLIAANIKPKHRMAAQNALRTEIDGAPKRA